MVGRMPTSTACMSSASADSRTLVKSAESCASMARRPPPANGCGSALISRLKSPSSVVKCGSLMPPNQFRDLPCQRPHCARRSADAFWRGWPFRLWPVRRQSRDRQLYRTALDNHRNTARPLSDLGVKAAVQHSFQQCWFGPQHCLRYTPTRPPAYAVQTGHRRENGASVLSATS